MATFSGDDNNFNINPIYTQSDYNFNSLEFKGKVEELKRNITTNNAFDTNQSHINFWKENFPWYNDIFKKLKTTECTVNKEYFRLLKLNTDNPQIESDEPCYALSLFIDSRMNLDDDVKKSTWIFYYLILQYKAILIFKHFNPKSNIVILVDYFLLNLIKDGTFKLSESFKTILSDPRYKYLFDTYYDTTDNNIPIIQSKQTQLYEYILRICNLGMSDIDLYINIHLYISNRYLVMYEYLFASSDTSEHLDRSPFIMKNGDKYCHINNGYIGQLVRFLILIQSPKIFKHICFLDPHSNILTSVSNEWINNLNTISKSNKEQIFFLPTSHKYSESCSSWHNVVQYPYNEVCDKAKDDNICGFYKISGIAGQIQCTNFKDDKLDYFSKETYLKTIGLVFLLSDDNSCLLYTSPSPRDV
jgi:hypothetical protein